MFGQVIPRSFLWFVSLCAVLIIGIIGCGGDNGDDDDDWVGTWSQWKPLMVRVWNSRLQKILD